LVADLKEGDVRYMTNHARIKKDFLVIQNQRLEKQRKFGQNVSALVDLMAEKDLRLKYLCCLGEKVSKLQKKIATSA
jgi:hypothetical protein